MLSEMPLRQRAIRLKQAGWSVSWICRRLERGRDWFYKWWGRYAGEGAAGLRERSRAPHTAQRVCPPDMRQAILEIRDRLVRRHGPRGRYRLAGAPTIRYELACLGYETLPSLRTIERVLQSEGRTSPAFRPQPRATSSDYPGRPATHSNQLHHMDLIGPRYLKGSRRQWFFLVYRDSYDHAVYVEFQPKPKMEGVLDFVVRAWQRLGLPDRLQVDNSELFGLTSHPGSLSRFVRLALWVGVELTFIPEHEPWRNGAIEWFNGWLQERVLSIPLRSAAQVHREVRALMMTCWEEHVHPNLNFQTTAQVRRHLTPEHGFLGNAAAGATINDTTDVRTQLKVISLYGNKKKPEPGDLQEIEIMLFDLQDVGTRFYTYISTLALVMEACAGQGIPLIILDRPNPNAFYIDGPVLDTAYRSFVGLHPVPIVYGMTIAEYAMLVNGEGWLSDSVRCELTVVPLQKWERNMIINLAGRPSPNLQTWQAIYLYPSLCLFEGTVMSVGRGTDLPFQVIGHPKYLTGSYDHAAALGLPGGEDLPRQDDVERRLNPDEAGKADSRRPPG